MYLFIYITSGRKRVICMSPAKTANFSTRSFHIVAPAPGQAKPFFVFRRRAFQFPSKGTPQKIGPRMFPVGKLAESITPAPADTAVRADNTPHLLEPILGSFPSSSVASLAAAGVVAVAKAIVGLCRSARHFLYPRRRPV